MISVIVPMKNEAKNCEPLVRAIAETAKRHKWPVEAILVNDASTDNTKEVVEKLAKKYGFVRPIHRRPPSGPGRAQRDGFRAAKGDVIVTMDGDLSHDPREMPRLIAELRNADIVCGSRSVKGGKAQMQKSRVIMSGLYKWLFRLLIGIPVRDFTSGYRAYRREAIRSLKLDAKMFGIYVEIPIKAHIKGFRFAEVPITYRKRLHGKTNLNYLKQGPEYAKYALLGVKARVAGG
jgi:glycosyltransferase involved in cell wall biosynthesis